MIFPAPHPEPTPPCNPLTSERGAALIIVMVMLLLLMILGATLLTSSTTELRIAGNYRNTEDAFYSSDALIEVLYTGYLPKNSKLADNTILSEDVPISDLVRPGGTPVQATYQIDNKKVSYTIGYIKKGSDRTLAGTGYGEEFVDFTSVYFMDVSGADANDRASVDLEAAFALIEP